MILILFETQDSPSSLGHTHETLWLECGFHGTWDSSLLKSWDGVCDQLCGASDSSQLKSWYEVYNWLRDGSGLGVVSLLGVAGGLPDTSWGHDGAGLGLILMLDVAGVDACWTGSDCIFFWGNGSALGKPYACSSPVACADCVCAVLPLRLVHFPFAPTQILLICLPELGTVLTHIHSFSCSRISAYFWCWASSCNFISVISSICFYKT